MFHRLLPEFSGNHQATGRLDFAGGDGLSLVVAREMSCLRCNSAEDVFHKVVHDCHGCVCDRCPGMNGLQYLVDVVSVVLVAIGAFYSRHDITGGGAGGGEGDDWTCGRVHQR